MGTLEDLRAEVLATLAAPVEADIRAQAVAALDRIIPRLDAWGLAGCPGYEPEPWGEPGVVPDKPGVYAVWAPGVDEVDVFTLRASQWSPFTPQSYRGFRVRYLGPIPTPPEAP